MNKITSLMIKELARANHIHAKTFNSPHEGYAVMLEEMDELFDEIRKKRPDNVRMLEEAVQVGAMAIKFIQSLEKGKYVHEIDKWDICDDCSDIILLNGDSDFFIESGTHGIPKGERSKMVCRRC